jgi:hypothetical protein
MDYLISQATLQSNSLDPSWRAFEHALETLPSQRHDVYQGALDRIYKPTRDKGRKQEKQNLAIHALAWLAFAKRIMNSTELHHALAIEVGDPAKAAQRLTSSCKGLVVVDERTHIVSLAHPTVHDFLEEKSRSSDPADMAAVDLRKARSGMAATCLSYLLREQLPCPPAPSNATPQDRTKPTKISLPTTFLNYAADFWGHHLASLPASSSSPEVSSTVDHAYQLASKLFETPAFVNRAFRAMSNYRFRK